MSQCMHITKVIFIGKCNLYQCAVHTQKDHQLHEHHQSAQFVETASSLLRIVAKFNDFGFFWHIKCQRNYKTFSPIVESIRCTTDDSYAELAV